MEPPASLGAADLQAAREKVIKSFRPLDPGEVVLGQFNGVAAKSRPPPIASYPPGSWGPAQARELIAPGRWLLGQ